MDPAPPLREEATLKEQTKLWIRSFSPTTPFYVVVALLCSAPAWIAKYPPIQDLPFHLATIRVIHSLRDPAYGLGPHFVLTLGRTQYVFYYLVASLLSYVTGIRGANTVMMMGYLAGTPLALRALLKSFGKDERLCLLSIPLLVNVMFMFGLLPFLVGIPIMFWALAISVRYFEEPTLEDGVVLAFLVFALFYSHIFPFGIFGLGFAAMFPWSPRGGASPNAGAKEVPFWKRWLFAGLPTVPALAALVYWTLFTPAGNLTRGALAPGEADHVQPLNDALPGVFKWLTDIWQDTSDEAILVALFLVVVLMAGLSQGDAEKPRPVARAYVLLPFACVIFYLRLGEGHDYIWLISQRFPILFLLTMIPLLRMPKGGRGVLVAALALGVALASTWNTCRHFKEFERDEVGDIDGAIDQMEPGKKVCALIYDKGSQISNWVPFLHYGSYYQLRKGGVVEFTYAGYLHWPFTFKPGMFPPPGGPARKRWEWMPESVSMGEIHPYYDYVLTRGEGFHPPADKYQMKWHSDVVAPPRGEGDRPAHHVIWQVWERVR